MPDAMRTGVRTAGMTGYTLIEIALVMVILGLLLGGALVPMHHRHVANQIDETRDLVLQAQEAVEGFALNHRTRPRDFIYHSRGRQSVPAGRPYLPCPDIDADGLEDRQPIPSGLFTVTAMLGDYQVRPSASTVTVVLSPGSCWLQKGLLPWRTLGMDSGLDAWGNFLLYRVDLAFSDALLGFDELHYADSSDPRREPVPVRPVPARALPEEGGVRNFYNYRQLPDDNGAIVCETDRRVDTLNEGCPSAFSYFNIAGIKVEVLRPRQWLGEKSDNTEGVLFPSGRARIVSVGVNAESGFSDAHREIHLAVGDVVDGLPAVIFSSGRNQYGALNPGETPGEIRCKYLPPRSERSQLALTRQPESRFDAVNLYFRDGHPLVQHDSCADVRAIEGIFNEASYVFSSIPGEENDDIGVWTSSQQLVGMFLRNFASPLPCVRFLPDTGSSVARVGTDCDDDGVVQRAERADN